MGRIERAKRLGGALALLGGLLLLAACARNEAAAVACPTVLILGDAGRFTQFRPGGGRDITDIEAEGEIAGFRGACERTKDGIDLTLALAFQLSRGAADSDRQIDFSYFVAVPAFYPDAKAKAVLPVRVAVPDNVSMMRYVDEQVTLKLPLEPGESGGRYEVFIGFQLDEEQLRHNRQRK